MATQTSQDKILTQYASKIDSHLAELFNLVEYTAFDTKDWANREKDTLRGYFDSFEKKYTRIYKKIVNFKY